MRTSISVGGCAPLAASAGSVATHGGSLAVMLCLSCAWNAGCRRSEPEVDPATSRLRRLRVVSATLCLAVPSTFTHADIVSAVCAASTYSSRSTYLYETQR